MFAQQTRSAINSYRHSKISIGMSIYCIKEYHCIEIMECSIYQQNDKQGELLRTMGEADIRMDDNDNHFLHMLLLTQVF